jgi:hypothetical protein
MIKNGLVAGWINSGQIAWAYTATTMAAYALFTIIGTHYLLDDLDVTTATSERIHTGNAFFIVIDMLCVIVCVAGVALFMSLCWASESNRPERW